MTRFHKPCIMDVKVGRRVWDDFANSDKIDKEKRKYPLQEIIGFRVTGMRVSTIWKGRGSETLMYIVLHWLHFIHFSIYIMQVAFGS